MGLTYNDAISGKLTAQDLEPDSRIHLKTDFDSYSQYEDWIEDYLGNMKLSKNRDRLWREYRSPNPQKDEAYVRRKSDWLGTDSLEELKGEITEYLRPEALEEVRSKLDDEIRNLDAFNRLRKKQLNFNDYGRGIFSFALASRGLVPIMEYYDDKTGEVVDSKRVRERKASGGKEFYDKENGHLLIHRKKMRTKEGERLREQKELLKASLESKKMSEEDRKKVQERIDELEKQIKKHVAYTSTVKKSFIDIPETKEARTIDFYVSAGASRDLSAQELAMKAVAAIVLAEKLEKIGFNVRINVVYGTWYDERYSNFYGFVVPAKDYDEPVDTNLLALMASDPRVFRYKTFQTLIGMYDYFNQIAPKGLGRPSKTDTHLNRVRKEFIRQAIQKAKISNPRAETDRSNYAKYFFGQNIRNVDEAVEEYKKVLGQIEQTYSELADKPETTHDDYKTRAA